MIFRFIFTLLLAGCAITPAPISNEPANYGQHLHKISTISHFAVSARIAILTDIKNFSGSIRWHHRPDGNNLIFYSPFGTQLGQLTADSNGVTLTTSEQKKYQARDAETLMQQTLGWSFPMNGLTDWMLGRPAEGLSQILTWDDHGRITRMQQNDWDISYPAYKGDLPSKVLLNNLKLDVKLVIDHWQTNIRK